MNPTDSGTDEIPRKVVTVRSADGTAIVMEVVGTGAPVVLVCGAGTTRAMNSPLADLLAHRFTVHNYDRRGRGESGDTQPFAVEREDEDLRAVIELAGGRAAVFGSSSGAAVAAGAAARGAAIDRLALWEVPYVIDGTREFPADYEQHVRTLLDDGRHDEVLEYFLTAAAQVPAEMVAGIRQSPFWGGMVALAPTIAYDAAATVGGVPTDLLRRVRADTLVLDGGTQPWMAATAHAVAAAVPGATRRTLAGQTHDFDPVVMAGTLVEFFGAAGV